METIRELFSKPIDRRIEEVIKVDQADEKTVLDELQEYVITESIGDHFTTVYKAIADAPSEPHEGIGIWVSGFFGSGKSSFAKIIGYTVGGRTVCGQSASHIVREKARQELSRTEADTLVAYLDVINAKIPTHAIIFDVSMDRGVRTANERITEIMYKALLRELGYAEDFDLAELEISLEADGLLDKFREEFQALHSNAWEVRRKLGRGINEASAVLNKLDQHIYPKAVLIESQLACADIHMLDGNRLQQFLAETGLRERPIYGRILSVIQQRLKDADQLGSLLRLDEEIRTLVEEERRQYERIGRQPDLFGWPKEQFETEAGQREFWEMLEIQIGQALDAFARERAAEGVDQGFFVAEATKGLRLLEIMGQHYDVVLTNPPYMTSRNMNTVLKEYLQKAYPVAKADLYAAFVQRCTEWLADNGRLGMITQQSFMFISSYEKLREFLRERTLLKRCPTSGREHSRKLPERRLTRRCLSFAASPMSKPVPMLSEHTFVW